MLFKDFQLTIVNSIILSMRLIEEALSQVVSKQMPNCSMKPHGKQKVMSILTSLEQSTETGIINQNHSTNLSYLIPTEEWRRRSKFTTFKISQRKSTGIRVFKQEHWPLLKVFMLQDKVLSTRASSHSKFEIDHNKISSKIFSFNYLPVDEFFFLHNFI
jgi:hypothetical protein